MTTVGEAEGSPQPIVDELERVIQNEELLRDLKIIGQELAAEARRRDWCQEYEMFIDKVNAMTHGVWLTPFELTQTVNFRITLRMTGDRMEMHNLPDKMHDALASVVEHHLRPLIDNYRDVFIDIGWVA